MSGLTENILAACGGVFAVSSVLIYGLLYTITRGIERLAAAVERGPLKIIVTLDPRHPELTKYDSDAPAYVERVAGVEEMEPTLPREKP